MWPRDWILSIGDCRTLKTFMTRTIVMGTKGERTAYGIGALSDVARAFLRFASAIRSSSLLRLVITDRSSRMVWNSSCLFLSSALISSIYPLPQSSHQYPTTISFSIPSPISHNYFNLNLSFIERRTNLSKPLQSAHKGPVHRLETIRRLCRN
jgi:hypothetical protein